MREANAEFLQWMEKKGVIFATGRHPFDRMFDHQQFGHWEVPAEVVWQLITDDFHGYLKSMKPSLSSGQLTAIVTMYHDLQSKEAHIQGYYSDQLVLDRDGVFHQTTKALGCQGITSKGRHCGNSLVANHPEQTFLRCGALVEGVDVPAGSLFRWFCEHHEQQRQELRPQSI